MVSLIVVTAQMKPAALLVRIRGESREYLRKTGESYCSKIWTTFYTGAMDGPSAVMDRTRGTVLPVHWHSTVTTTFASRTGKGKKYLRQNLFPGAMVRMIVETVQMKLALFVALFVRIKKVPYGQTGEP